jgi:hypothetical protein
VVVCTASCTPTVNPPLASCISIYDFNSRRLQQKILYTSSVLMHILCRHYKQAYSLLTEIKQNEMNILEIKIVAGFINYKVRIKAKSKKGGF